MRTIVRRRICWPNPDATCLEGGCGHCNSSRFRMVTSIEKYAAKAGITGNRAVGEQDAMTAFTWGLRHNFCNAEIEWSQE